MDRNAIREAWDDLAAPYAEMRDPDGEDAALIDELLDQLPAHPRVLDVGCGDGMRTLARLDEADAVGVDISRRQLQLARSNVPWARLLQGDMTALPLAADDVDAVTAYHAVFHVPRADHRAVYEEFARVLRPGGYVLSTLGGGRYEQVRSNWLGTGRSMLFSTPGKRATLSLLRDAGFEIVWDRVVDDPLGSSTSFVLARLSA
ncbi:methyltransferase domain-containing protein [Halapricum sp. CBA1109]|uniref:class I SAM-dependent methyltransferase n=1 Tax=Halapricum sp. CBA1109 TaxID=2668068 RepID=UPI0012F9421F|nr:class I SAM-dependent methyltransferase [Halapricum sp. CBA1109]MUV89887.1 methyltransferase domain-containing protein [Halapricum sp. CBA1109]